MRVWGLFLAGLQSLNSRPKLRPAFKPSTPPPPALTIQTIDRTLYLPTGGELGTAEPTQALTDAGD
jgi:hypothetical protein